MLVVALVGVELRPRHALTVTQAESRPRNERLTDVLGPVVQVASALGVGLVDALLLEVHVRVRACGVDVDPSTIRPHITCRQRDAIGIHGVGWRAVAACGIGSYSQQRNHGQDACHHRDG